MTPQELKNSILQLATQGKLVEQRPEEGTAAELLEKIFAAKNAKDAKKNLTHIPRAKRVCEADALAGVRRREDAEATKESRLASNVSRPVEDAPFDIPESWEWVRIGEVFNLQAGKNIKSDEIHQEYSPEHRYKCYGGNGCRGYVADYNRKGHYVLIGRQGALCGNINYAEGDFYATEHAVVVEQFAGTDVYWCGYFLDALNLNRYATATAQPGLAVVKINQVLIPLPPLAEQKRIVAKIEELLPLIDRYEKAWSKLEDFNKRFPVDMQKSLLQMAIQGKLVEQRPEEGSAAELLKKILAAKNAKSTKKNLTRSRGARGEKTTSALSASPREKIPDDEKTFDIPESWEWVRLGEIAESIQYGYSAPARQSGRIRMIRITDIQNGKINWDTVPFCDILENDIGRYLVGSGDILFARTGGTVGKSYLVRDLPQESIYAGYLIRTRFLKCVLPQYAKTFFESDIYWKQLKDGLIATAQPNFNGKKLALMLVPLPPLAEQKRIVAKLEELLPLCERLK